MNAAEWDRETKVPSFLMGIPVALVLSMRPTASLGASVVTATATDQLQTVIVTAEKRKENSQSVPISLTALSGAQLEQRNVRDLSDLSSFVPGLSFTGGAGTAGGALSSSIFIRGVGQFDYQPTTDPGVGIYVDGVYYGRSVGSMLNILDVSSVEVLRGPQGTLFGRNTLGGAINIVSQMPTDMLGGYIKADVGNFGTSDVIGVLNAPIVSDRLALRVSFGNLDNGPYEHSALTGQGEEGAHTQTGRAVLSWTPSDAFSFDLIADGTHTAAEPEALHLLAVNPGSGFLSFFNCAETAGSPCAPTNPSQYGPVGQNWLSPNVRYNYSIGIPSYLGPNENNLTVAGIAANLQWRISDSATLTSISSYRYMLALTAADQGGVPETTNEIFTHTFDAQYGEELRLGGVAWNSKLKYLIGAYFQREVVNDYYRFVLYPALIDYGVNVAEHFTDHDTDVADALFTQETYDILPAFSLTAGVRYSVERKGATYQDLFLTVPGELPPAFGTGILPNVTSKRDMWSAWTPKVSLQYHPTDDLNFYLSYAKGFKSGGFQYTITTSSDFQPYNPEYLTTYELGAKTTWLHDHLRVDGDIFTSSYKDMQFYANVHPGAYTCPTQQDVILCVETINAAAARMRGAELEIDAIPVRGLTVYTNVAYLDSYFSAIQPALLNSVINYSTVLPFAPKWTEDLGGQYTFPVTGGGSVAVRADVNYKSRWFVEYTDNPYLENHPMWLLSARLAYVSANGRWEIAVAGKNLTNRYVITTGVNNLDNLGMAAGAYAQPRTVFGSVKYSFGGN